MQRQTCSLRTPMTNFTDRTDPWVRCGVCWELQERCEFIWLVLLALKTNYAHLNATMVNSHCWSSPTKKKRHFTAQEIRTTCRQRQAVNGTETEQNFAEYSCHSGFRLVTSLHENMKANNTLDKNDSTTPTKTAVTWILHTSLLPSTWGNHPGTEVFLIIVIHVLATQRSACYSAESTSLWFHPTAARAKSSCLFILGYFSHRLCAICQVICRSCSGHRFWIQEVFILSNSRYRPSFHYCRTGDYLRQWDQQLRSWIPGWGATPWVQLRSSNSPLQGKPCLFLHICTATRFLGPRSQLGSLNIYIFNTNNKL